MQPICYNAHVWKGTDWTFLQILHPTLTSKGGTCHPQNSSQSWVGPVDSKTGSLCLRGRGGLKRAEQHKRKKDSPECFERLLEQSKERWQAQRGRTCYDESLAGYIICVAGGKPTRFRHRLSAQTKEKRLWPKALQAACRARVIQRRCYL